MVEELPTAGYESFRSLVNSSQSAPDQWDYIALIDDGDSEVLRVSVTGDSRASWSEQDQNSDSTDETMVATITVQGSDGDVTTPVTIVESRLYDTDSGGSSLSEDTFDDVTLSGTSDQAEIVHNVEIPEIS